MADELEKLLELAKAHCEEGRKVLARMRPQIEWNRDSIRAIIDDLSLRPQMLFGHAPPHPKGGHCNLSPKIEAECAAAVIRVLKRRLAKIESFLRREDDKE